MPFKDISYLKLWQPFCSAERNHFVMLVEAVMRINSVNHLCNFERWLNEEHSCEVI